MMTKTIARLSLGVLGVGLGLSLISLGSVPAPAAVTRTVPVNKVDEALAQQNLSSANQAWHDAYRAALASRRWDRMVEVGDAALRIGEVAGARGAAEPLARKSYLAALLRARQEQSLEGVLRAAEAFAALGDLEVAEQGVRVAERIAARAPETREARERLLQMRERLAARVNRADWGVF